MVNTDLTGENIKEIYKHAVNLLKAIKPGGITENKVNLIDNPILCLENV